jgi:hypothetical protein
MADNCTTELDEYHNHSITSKQVVYNLTRCIIGNMDDFHPVEMSITSVLLGLLPMMLQMVGPTVKEVSLLAFRRPILALLLRIAMPSASMSGEDPTTTLGEKASINSHPGFLARRWGGPLVSMLEYLIAILAVANVSQQAYQLAYWSISISAIAIDSGMLPETYPPFLWNLLVIPTHLLGCWVLNLRFEKIPLEDYQSAKRFRRLRIWLSFELTPCAYGKPMVLIKRRAKGSEHNRSLLCAVVKWLADLGVVVVFVYGSVALASQVFISLGDAGTVIARYIISAIMCRLVLQYELNGLRDVLTREG